MFVDVLCKFFDSFANDKCAAIIFCSRILQLEGLRIIIFLVKIKSYAKNPNIIMKTESYGLEKKKYLLILQEFLRCRQNFNKVVLCFSCRIIYDKL